ncbi:Sec23-binding domain of Sec16-domain-containing protein [Coemansia spiralis]|nr:Sec23-binding domain of Sec16-domain-containing protein [Coemansia spiralis]
MSQTPTPLSKRPPSRRGTPSTNEPIPFFSSHSENDAAGTDFFSSIASAQPQSANIAAYQTTGVNSYGQQQGWMPTQPGMPYGQTIPHEVPPRCATGPAHVQSYPDYGSVAQSANTMANADLYRSASVVYSGAQYNQQYYSISQQPHINAPSVASWAPDGSSFFDQLTASAAPSLSAQPTEAQVSLGVQPYYDEYSTGYYPGHSGNSYAGGVPTGQAEVQAYTSGNIADYSSTYASGTVTGEDENNGVIYDESTGQYYDTNSGQYYDNITGMWYYPEQPATEHATSAGTGHSGHAVALVTDNIDTVQDGAAFFDSLVSSQSHATDLASQPNVDVQESGTANSIAESQVTGPHTVVADIKNVQDTTTESLSAASVAASVASFAQPKIELDSVLPAALHMGDVLQPQSSAEIGTQNTASGVVESLISPMIDVTLNDTVAILDSSPHILSGLQMLGDPATVAAAAVAAATSKIDETSRVVRLEESASLPSAMNTSEFALYQPETAADNIEKPHTFSTTAAINTVVDEAPQLVPQPQASGNDNASAFYSQQYCAAVGPASVEVPSDAYNDDSTLDSQAPIVEPSAPYNNNTPKYGASDSIYYSSGDTSRQHVFNQPIGQIGREGSSSQAHIPTSQPLLAVPPTDGYWNSLHTEQPHAFTTTAESSVVTNSVGMIEVPGYATLQDNMAAGYDNRAPATVAVSNDDSYLQADGVAYGVAGSSTSYQAHEDAYKLGTANRDAYYNTGANDVALYYSFEGDTQQQHQSQQQQYNARAYADIVTTSEAIYDQTSYLPPAASTPANNSVQMLYGNASLQQPPQQPATGFEFHNQMDRTSTELSYYDRSIGTAEMDQSTTEGIADPLGRLNACYPVVAFGFGGKMITMFPKSVQRLHIYDSEKASRVAPGILHVRQLMDCISTATGTTGPGLREPLLLGGAPLIAGEATRSALLKRRDIAVAGGQAWLDAAVSVNALSREEKVLFEVLISVLAAFEETDAQKLDLSRALQSIRQLCPSTDGSSAGNSQAVSDMLPTISHGTSEQIRSIEALLLDGKREDAIGMACSQGLWAHAFIIASCTGKRQWQSVVSTYTKDVLSDDFSSLATQYRLFSGLGADSFDGLQAVNSNGSSAKEDQFVTAADIGSIHTNYRQPLSQYPQVLSTHQSVHGASVQSENFIREEAVNKDWAKTLSLILANRTSGDQAAILKLGDHLRSSGNILAAHVCYVLTLQSKDIFVPDASQSAYPRAILVGADEFDRNRVTKSNTFGLSRTPLSRYYRYGPAIIATELYELAFALKAISASDSQVAGSTPTHGQSTPNPSTGVTNGASSGAQGSRPALLLCLPHFQAYKLYYAWWLTDCGQTALASRYCDAILGILATLPQGIAVPFIHASLVQGLRDLRERLSGTGMTSIKAAEMVGDGTALSGASSKSWLARAMPRPSFTSLMTVFDSSIDKFITGADGSQISLESSGTLGKFEIGPDRQSLDQQHEPSKAINTPRPLGAASLDGRTPSPYLLAAGVPRSSLEQTGGLDAYIPAYSSPRQSMDGRPVNGMYGAQSGQEPELPRMFTPSNMSSYGEQIPYGSSQQAIQSTQQLVQPPAHPQWSDPENPNMYGTSDQSEFITPASALGNTVGLPVNPSVSGMTGAYTSSNVAAGYAYQGYATTSAAPDVQSTSRAETYVNNDDNDEEDMFGFSRKIPVAQQPAQPGSTRQSMDAVRKSTSSVRKSTDVKDDKNATKSDADSEEKSAAGVFGILKSIWGGRKNQANLGEESHFVYDPELKRWVDKNAPDSQQDAGPTLPPPPSMMRFQPQSASVPPPPVSHVTDSRPGSVFPPHPSTDPSRSGTPASTFDSRTPTGLPPPSMSSAKPPAKRRGARTKYVDIMS